VLLGCDVAEPSTTDSSRGFDRPPVQVIGVNATTSYDAFGQPFGQVTLEEGALTQGVALSASFRIYFDRFLLPYKATRQAICIRPGFDPVPTSADCVDPAAVFTEPAYNPVAKEIIYRLRNPDGGAAQLLPDTEYRLTIFLQEDMDAPGIFAFDGAPLLRTYSFDFRTQPAGSPAFEEVAPTPEQYCEAFRCFENCAGIVGCQNTCRSLCIEPTCAEDGYLHRTTFLFQYCAFGGCHGPGTPTTNPDFSVVAAGLDLYSADGVAATAVNKTAHQTQEGQASLIGDQSPIRFGRAMPLIDPRNPGNSYLLYKALIHPLNNFHPGGLPDPGTEAEIGRLRASVVAGLPMPAEAGSFFGIAGPAPDGDNSEHQQDHAQMQLLSAWIAAGAVLTCD
jgi:hypothetical protein